MARLLLCDLEVTDSNPGNSLSAYRVRLRTFTLPKPHQVGASCIGPPFYSHDNLYHLFTIKLALQIISITHKYNERDDRNIPI